MIKVACIDDSSANNQILNEALAGSYEVQLFESAEAFLQQPNYLTEYDILLLDVDMPGLSGLELCKQLRHESSKQSIIHLSALNTVDDRLRGYAAGCDDYVCKPFDLDELKVKLRYFAELQLDKQKTANALQNASHAAMTAMQQAAEMGTLVTHSRDMVKVENYPELAEITQKLLLHFGLHGILRLENDIYSGPYTVVPMEMELLMRAQNAPRIMEYGRRAMYNSPHVSLLIRNHPEDDPDLAGRLRDHLAILIETLDAKVDTLNLKLNFEECTRRGIDKAITAVNNAFQQIDQAARTMDTSVKELLERGRVQVGEVLLSLSLNDSEEEQVMEVIDELFEQFIHIESQSLAMTDSVEQIIKVMEQLQG
jgi:DNA-binding response OmpR family regulator